MAINKKIFELMKEQGLSQKEFSILTGIPESTISDWKHKNNSPNVDKIMDICNALRVSPTDLLTDDNGGSKRHSDYIVEYDSDMGLVLDTFSKLDRNKQSRALAYMQGLLDS